MIEWGGALRKRYSNMMRIMMCGALIKESIVVDVRKNQENPNGSHLIESTGETKPGGKIHIGNDLNHRIKARESMQSAIIATGWKKKWGDPADTLSCRGRRRQHRAMTMRSLLPMRSETGPPQRQTRFFFGRKTRGCPFEKGMKDKAEEQRFLSRRRA